MIAFANGSGYDRPRSPRPFVVNYFSKNPENSQPTFAKRHMLYVTRVAMVAIATLACAPTVPTVIAPVAPSSAGISQADLRLRLEIVADDSMMGRQAGTEYHDRATEYIAAEAARIGLEPAGENGTYFQEVPLAGFGSAALTIGGREFVMGRDFVLPPPGPAVRRVAGAPTVFAGVYGDGAANLLSPSEAGGKVVVIRTARGWRASRGQLTRHYSDAAGILIATLDSVDALSRQHMVVQGVSLRAAESDSSAALPAFAYISAEMAEHIFGKSLRQLATGAAGEALTGELAVQPAPGNRNVVAILPGSDPALRGQYVAFGAHNDHLGFSRVPVDHDSMRTFNQVVRPKGADSPSRPATDDDWGRIRAILDSLRATRPPRPDSIYNGADDDGSGTVALLEVAEAFAQSATRPRRSLLFVWHTAEESGLLGSRYFSDHPTVTLDSIVALVNVDMIGRGRATDEEGGGPGYIQAIGSRRLSTELGQIVDEIAAAMNPRVQIDYQYDMPGHPQQYYCRSDHYMYARHGIPVVFFSTGGHVDYHQLTDEVQYIDFEKLANVSNFIYRIGERLAMQPNRPVVDQPKPGPNAPCVQ